MVQEKEKLVKIRYLILKKTEWRPTSKESPTSAEKLHDWGGEKSFAGRN